MHTIVGTILIIVGALALLLAASFFVLYRVFEGGGKRVGRATADLISVKHKKDVPIYGRRFFRGPIRVVRMLKNHSKGAYTYTVKGKTYTIRYAAPSTARQMPQMIAVVCWKRFPKLARAQTDTYATPYELYALASAMIGVALWFGGFPLFFH